MSWPASMSSGAFQSTHPARGATALGQIFGHAVGISIHAPREGCDSFISTRNTSGRYFNPRTPRGVRPDQSGSAGDSARNFNPRTPRGVRREELRYTILDISFQSTHPARGATLRAVDQLRLRVISIHAPREGCDRTTGRLEPTTPNFNPRTPRGVRQERDVLALSRRGFQSTHPARGATASTAIVTPAAVFQSTHPARGATRRSGDVAAILAFQSTHPARGAT